MLRVCVFDVNETLLDLRALDPHFKLIFGDAKATQEWFQQLLQSAMVSMVVGDYRDFGRIGIAALEMTAARRGLEIGDEDRQLIREGMQHLPAHFDVRESLERLRDAGVRLAALTNSTEKVAEAQLTNAGIRDLFEQVLSADAVQRLKPAPEPYRMAAERLGVKPSELRLVAAHAWDVVGALHAGCAAAFVGRQGMVLDPLFDRPDIVGTDLTEVADQILQRDR